jgi:DNA replication protein DnaC
VVTSPPRLARLRHGRLDPADPCPYGRCEGEGFVLDEEGLSRPCECRPARVAAAATRSLNRTIPKHFRDVAFDRDPVTKMDPVIVREVRRVCDTLDARLDEGESIAFYGPKGTGKTTLAMLVCSQALANRRTVSISTLPELLTKIHETYRERSPLTERELMDQLSAVDLLFIDDMAINEQPAPWVLTQLYSIINARYQDERSLLFTADVASLLDLEPHIGPRTASRLIEMVGQNDFLLQGEDHRIAVRPG